MVTREKKSMKTENAYEHKAQSQKEAVQITSTFNSTPGPPPPLTKKLSFWSFLTFFAPSYRTSREAGQGKAATLFSLFEPSGFFTLQLNLSWRHSRSSLGLFFSTTSTPPCRIDTGERGDWPGSVGEDRQNSVALETAEPTFSLCLTIYWQFHL